MNVWTGRNRKEDSIPSWQGKAKLRFFIYILFNVARLGTLASMVQLLYSTCVANPLRRSEDFISPQGPFGCSRRQSLTITTTH
jgi:hypothetical protein